MISPMSHAFRRLLSLVLYTALVAGMGLAWVKGGVNDAGAIAAIFVATIPPVGILSWGWLKSRTASPMSSPDQLDQAYRRLVDLVLAQWRTEAEIRQLDDPSPVAVRWRPTQLDVMDHPEHIVGSRRKVRFTGRSDQISKLAGEFRRLPRRRLVVIGEAGIGKTTLAVLLLRELLEHNQDGEPIPILLSLADFDPEVDTLHSWVVHQLASDYPALRAPEYGRSAIQDLVYGRRVLPVLDGLDEVPAMIRPKVIDALNATAEDPLILTCRTVEYVRSVGSGSGRGVTAAMVIAPDPLTSADITAYLSQCLPSRSLRSGPWVPILRSLSDHEDQILIAALATPFSLWLVRQVYITAGKDPTALLDRTIFPNSESIHAHLLDELIPAVLSTNRPASDHDSHPFRPRHTWSADKANLWLSYLASHLPGHDITWWGLRESHSRRATIIAQGTAYGIVIMLVACLVFGLARWSVRGVAFALTGGISYFLSLLLQAYITTSRRNKRNLALVIFLSGFTFTGAFTLVFGLWLSTPGSVSGVVLIGILSGTTMGISYWFGSQSNPAYASFGVHGRSRPLKRSFAEAEEEAGLGVWIAGVFIAVPILWLAREYWNHMTFVESLATIAIVFSSIGLVTWVVFVYAAGFLSWAQTPVATDRPGSPRGTLRGDLLLGTFRCLIIGTPIAVFVVIISIPSSVVELIVINSLAVGFLFGLIAGLGGQAYTYMVIKVRLSIKGLLPWRLMGFLEDTHRLGLLRQIGPVYQFRHAELREQLITSYYHKAEQGR
jgi:hypothetical protein